MLVLRQVQDRGDGGGRLARQMLRRVALHVRLQVGALVEAPVADGALVRRLLQVGHLVHGQGARLAEALAAVGALEGLLLRVDVAVVPQVVLPPERLAADVARVGTLVGVRALVDQQVVGLGELPVAVLADELLLGPRSIWAGALQSTRQMVAGQAHLLRVHPVVVMVGSGSSSIGVMVVVMMQGSSGGRLALQGCLAEPQEGVLLGSGGSRVAGKGVGVSSGSGSRGSSSSDGRLELGLRLQPEAVLALAEVLRVLVVESHWLLCVVGMEVWMLLLLGAVAVMVVVVVSHVEGVCVGVFGGGIGRRQNRRNTRRTALLLQQGHSREGDRTEV